MNDNNVIYLLYANIVVEYIYEPFTINDEGRKLCLIFKKIM